MFFFCIIFLFQSLFGANGLLTPSQLYRDGYGLPSCPTMLCINQARELKEYPIKEKKKSSNRNNKQKSNPVIINYQKVGSYFKIISPIHSEDVVHESAVYKKAHKHKKVSSSSSNSSDDEQKKKKKSDNSKVLLGAAAVTGAIGLGALVWDFWKHSKHEAKGCDYRLNQDGQMTSGVWYETHQASRWTASTLITWPDFCMGQDPMQVNFSDFYSQGILNVYGKVFLYGRDFSSLCNGVRENFYMKEIDINGKFLSTFVLPCKPKKILCLNGSFIMLSYDGYLYCRNTKNTRFERLYIKNSENAFFEETVIDILVPADDSSVVVWTDSGQLIQITASDSSIFPVVRLQIISSISMQDRSKYRIVECSDGNFSLVKSDDSNLKKLSCEYNFSTQNAIEKGAYRHDELPLLKKLLYGAYRFIINRPFKFVGISLIGLSFTLYMRYLKQR